MCPHSPSPLPATASSSTTRHSESPIAKISVEATTDNLFRIASVTKPITSVAIFILIEKGKLHLNDKVFGASGIFGNKYGKGTATSNTSPTSPSITCSPTPAEAGPTTPTTPCFSTIPGTRPN